MNLFSRTIVPLLLFIPGFFLFGQPYLEEIPSCYTPDPERLDSVFFQPEDGASYAFSAVFQAPDILTGEQIFLRIPSGSNPFEIKINAFPIGSYPGRVIPAMVNLTPFLKEENLLELKLTNTPSAGSSIHPPEGLTLYRRHGIHINHLTTEQFPGIKEGEILVRAKLMARSYQQDRIGKESFKLVLYGPNGEALDNQEKLIPQQLSFGQRLELDADFRIAKPELWSPSEPQLYRLNISYKPEGNGASERIQSRFGIRNYSYLDSLMVINNDTLPLIFERGPDQNALDLVKLPPCELLHWADSTGRMLLIKEEGLEEEVRKFLGSHPSVFLTP